MVNAQTRLTVLTAAAVLILAPLVRAQDPVDLLPAVEITGPGPLVGQTDPVALPDTIVITFDGSDPDGSSGQPVKFRYLLTGALLPGDTYADTQLLVDQFVMDLAPYYKVGWSDWQPWDPDPQARRIAFEGLPHEDGQGRLIYYLVVLQVSDEVSAVSIDRAYGVNLAHFYVVP